MEEGEGELAACGDLGAGAGVRGRPGFQHAHEPAVRGQEVCHMRVAAGALPAGLQ